MNAAAVLSAIELNMTGTDAGDEILIPASNDLIEEVSAEKKEIRMAIPEGLLDL